MIAVVQSLRLNSENVANVSGTLMASRKELRKQMIVARIECCYWLTYNMLETINCHSIQTTEFPENLSTILCKDTNTQTRNDFITSLCQKSNNAIADRRFCPQRAIHNQYVLMFIVEKNLVEINAVVSSAMLLLLRNVHNAPQEAAQRENMTPSTKPEVHNVSQHHQMRTELWRPQEACTKIWWSSVIWFLRYGQTNKRTNHNTLQPSEAGEVMNHIRNTLESYPVSTFDASVVFLFCRASIFSSTVSLHTNLPSTHNYINHVHISALLSVSLPNHRVKYIFYLESIRPIRTAENFEAVEWAIGFANKHGCIVELLE